jgi:hypothetical protein
VVAAFVRSLPGSSTPRAATELARSRALVAAPRTAPRPAPETRRPQSFRERYCRKAWPHPKQVNLSPSLGLRRPSEFGRSARPSRSLETVAAP